MAVRVNGGAPQAVVPGAAGKFVLDLSALDPGDATVQLVVTDTSGNTASASTTATIAADGALLADHPGREPSTVDRHRGHHRASI